MQFEWGTIIFQLFFFILFLLILLGVPVFAFRLLLKQNNNISELKRRIDKLEEEMNKHK